MRDDVLHLFWSDEKNLLHLLLLLLLFLLPLFLLLLPVLLFLPFASTNRFFGSFKSYDGSRCTYSFSPVPGLSSDADERVKYRMAPLKTLINVEPKSTDGNTDGTKINLW